MNETEQKSQAVSVRAVVCTRDVTVCLMIDGGGSYVSFFFFSSRRRARRIWTFLDFSYFCFDKRKFCYTARAPGSRGNAKKTDRAPFSCQSVHTHHHQCTPETDRQSPSFSVNLFIPITISAAHPPSPSLSTQSHVSHSLTRARRPASFRRSSARPRSPPAAPPGSACCGSATASRT
jgi:hypothetical protein